MIRPFPKPHFPPHRKPEWLPERKAVTVALGFNCGDGIVMCSDQQITSKGWHKYHESKMYAISSFGDQAPYTAMLTYAGDPHLAKTIYEKLAASQIGFDSTESLKSLLEGLLSEIPRDDAESTHFLCGFCRKPGILGLLRTSGYSVHEVGADRIGLGDSSLLSFLFSLMVAQPIDVWRAVVIGHYIIEQAKKFLDGCGGDTDIQILRGNGRFAPPDPALIEKSSEAATAIEHDIRSLLWMVRNGERKRYDEFWRELKAQLEVFVNPAANQAVDVNQGTLLSRLIPELQWTEPEAFSVQERTILIPKFSMHFRKVGSDPAFGNKPIVESDGEPVYPELAVTRLLKKHGIDAVWIDSYRGKFWEGMSQERTLPDAAREAYARILQENGGKRGGFWDVMAWRENEFVFIELKQNTAECKDRISEKQRNWLQAALRARFNPSCFFVCEWRYQQ